VKYNFDDLHWQEFESLCFKVLQIIVAPGVQYLPGGNDKGRDIVYTGSSTFNPSYGGKWLFQVKHKSKGGDDKELIWTLAADLKTELKKVFVTNQLEFDVYVLVTNKELTASGIDALTKAFNEFKRVYKINCQHFDLISYHHLASAFDDSDKLKWCYPNVISHPDFELLIGKIMTLHLENRRQGWLKGVQRQRDWFVYTRFFQMAWDKLNAFPAIILSGPPKSGKTFNAGILALNLSLFEGFQVIVVAKIEDMELAYRIEMSQVFIFDDAFGKHKLTYDSGEWFARLEHIFELADRSHLFIFTSREYVFREFVNYGNERAKELLEKIIIESHGYNKEEKLSLLKRYVLLSTLTSSEKETLLFNEEALTDHRNFSITLPCRSFWSDRWLEAIRVN
jgi:hypothetical protein